MDCSTEAKAAAGCPVGSYVGAGGCTVCPAGSHCSGSTATAVTSGHYSAAGDRRQRLCPAGYDCSSGSAAVALSAGSFSLEGAAGPSQCPVGVACPDPAAYSSKLDCVALAGYYGDALGLSACRLCPAGSACQASSGTVTVCTAGSYSTPGVSACFPSPAGHACYDRDKETLIPWSLGIYAVAGAAACIPCPTGYSCSPAGPAPVVFSARRTQAT